MANFYAVEDLFAGRRAIALILFRDRGGDRRRHLAGRCSFQNECRSGRNVFVFVS